MGKVQELLKGTKYDSDNCGYAGIDMHKDGESNAAARILAERMVKVLEAFECYFETDKKATRPILKDSYAANKMRQSLAEWRELEKK